MVAVMICKEREIRMKRELDKGEKMANKEKIREREREACNMKETKSF